MVIDYEHVWKLLQIAEGLLKFPNLTGLAQSVNQELAGIESGIQQELSGYSAPALPGQPVTGLNSPEDVTTPQTVAPVAVQAVAAPDGIVEQGSLLDEPVSEIPPAPVFPEASGVQQSDTARRV